MQVSIIRQTPAVSILLMLQLVVAAILRFALAPYGDELTGGLAALPGTMVDAFQSNHPVWGWILSALIVVVNSLAVGKMTTSLGLYQARTTISMPLYAIIACGIFVATDSLAVFLAVYFVAQMLRYLCGGYVRGTSLNYVLYAGLCAGVAPLLYGPTVAMLLLLPIAILMFGFSWREVVVMIVGLLLPLAALCYIGWLCGGEFLAPAVGLWDAIITSTGYTPWGSESVVALVLMGVLLFATICGISAFVGDKRSVGMRPRTILTFHIVALVVACAAFALPSATTGMFALVALPMSMLIPVGLLRIRDELSNLVVIVLILLMILHFFIA